MTDLVERTKGDRTKGDRTNATGANENERQWDLCHRRNVRTERRTNVVYVNVLCTYKEIILTYED